MMPNGGWRGTLTETEWLCFYDAKGEDTLVRSRSLYAHCHLNAYTVPSAAT